jgi:hypothetical protein
LISIGGVSLDHTIEFSDEIHNIVDGSVAFLKRIWLKPNRSYVRYASPLRELNQKDFPVINNDEKKLPVDNH